MIQTLPANNPDGKGPDRGDGNKPTDQDPDPHNPPKRVPGPREALESPLSKPGKSAKPSQKSVRP